MDNQKLIFVYNATMNPVSLIKDFVAELLPQQQTECVLCSLTYSLVFQKKEWKDFIDNLPCQTDFLLKDQFIRKYGAKYDTTFPAVFTEDASSPGELTLFIPAEEINAAENLAELMQVVRDALRG